MALVARVNQNQEPNVQHKMAVVMVPEDPRARLMYYINCVGRLLDIQGLDPFVERLQLYNVYSDIVGPPLVALMRLAHILRPENLFGRCLFVNDELCYGSNASFLILEKSEVATVLSINPGGVHVQGQVREVSKIMVVPKAWLVVNFYGPFVVLVEIIKAQVDRINRKNESCACAIL